MTERVYHDDTPANWIPMIQPEPSSRETALAELERIKAEVVRIDHDLGDLNRTDDQGRRLTHEAWSDWRRRAKGARRIKSERRTFLVNWLHTHPPDDTRPGRFDFPGVPTVALARRLARRVGHLESVYYAARAWTAAPSEEAARLLTDRVAAAAVVLDAPVTDENDGTSL